MDQNIVKEIIKEKVKNRSRTSECPVKKCPIITKHMKQHVYCSHIPKLFWDNIAEMTSDRIQSKRAEALEMLSGWLLGQQELVNNLHIYLNTLHIVPKDVEMNQNSLKDVAILCYFKGWPFPSTGFSLNPINSPACLIHWRCLVVLLDLLNEHQRSLFNQTFKSVSVDLLTRSPSIPEASTCSATITLPQSDTSKVSILQCSNSSFFRDCEDAVEAIDSHMHLDRTCQRMHGQVSMTATVDDILAIQPLVTPMRINLKGVVAVYCDPENYPCTLPEDSRVKVAVGVHPKKIHLLTDARKEKLISFLKDSRVTALGEVGFDLTEPTQTWSQQLESLETIIQLGIIGQPLVLHIRGKHNVEMNPYQKVFEIVQEHCGRAKPIHLHCFGGTAVDVRGWISVFRNCFFGFTASVAYFSKDQLLGLREVPLDKILVETDSPYLSPLPGVLCNTPAFIGNVGHLVAERKGVEFETIMHWSYENARKLYKF